MEVRAMIVFWGAGEVVEVDDSADDGEALTEADVAELVAVFASSTKLSFVKDRLVEQITEHQEAGRLQAATNASAVLAALLVRTRGAVH
jgi:hypothetical protein